MRKFLEILRDSHGLKINISEVVSTNHLNKDGSMNYEEVLNTLKRLFR